MPPNLVFKIYYAKKKAHPDAPPVIALLTLRRRRRPTPGLRHRPPYRLPTPFQYFRRRSASHGYGSGPRLAAAITRHMPGDPTPMPQVADLKTMSPLIRYEEGLAAVYQGFDSIALAMREDRSWDHAISNHGGISPTTRLTRVPVSRKDLGIQR
ncbi:hypothetical protein U1Q18_008598 [Sarracenia purpurea var. burkii]